MKTPVDRGAYKQYFHPIFFGGHVRMIVYIVFSVVPFIPIFSSLGANSFSRFQILEPSPSNLLLFPASHAKFSQNIELCSTYARHCQFSVS